MSLIMPHARLDSKITRSSLWQEPEYVRCVWIAILANKDENGYVESTYEWLRGESNLTDDEDGKKFASAISCLESPDLISKNKEFEGKRIIRVDGGWIVTGHEKYRMREDEIREQTKKRVARYREKLKNNDKNNNVTQCNVTSESVTLPPVSVSVSVSDSSSEEINSKARKKQPPEWKSKCDTFINYQLWVLSEFNTITSDIPWIRQQEELNIDPYGRKLNIILTLKKAYTNFWSQIPGWKNIKARRGDTVDWKSTWANALTMRCNQVWENNKQSISETDSQYTPL